MNPTRGILLITAALGVFSIMIALIKAAERIPAGEAVFFRSACALPVIVLWLWLRGDLRGGLATDNYKGHILRSVAGTISMGLSFAGLKYLPLPEVSALRSITPILMVIFAALILGEKFRLVRLAAVTMGLVGVLIILWPRLGQEMVGEGSRETIGVMLILGSASFAAMAQIFIKRMAGVEKTATIVFFFSMTSLTLSLTTLPFGWVWPTGLEWVLLIGAGVTGGLGQILLTSSYRFADASMLAPFTYVSMIYALIIGFFVFSEVPTVQMLLGASLVILSGVGIVWRERQLGHDRLAARKVSQPR